MAGIYVHIPFCASKCTYCDFASYPKQLGKAESYFACMIKEIKYRSQQLKDKTFQTVYFGGGTPSFVKPEYILLIMQKLRQYYNIDQNAEITLEANPGTVTKQKLEIYKQAGINRYSLGLQSAYDKRLASLNRIHTAKQFEECCQLLKGYNLSVDVMIGLSDQKEQEVKDTIDLAVNGGASHISVYALKAEEGTPMFTNYLNGELPSEDETADLYYFAVDYLKKFNFERYEVSNFCKAGFQSKHNLNYWQRGEYIGFGVSASSCIDDVRFTNSESIDEYVHCLLHDKYAQVFSEKIEGKEIKFEYVMLNLRTAYGVDLAKYKQYFNSDFLTDFKDAIKSQRKYLEIDEQRVKILDEFLYTQNQIIINFMD